LKEIIIYTDGAARNNPGRGGYGAILMYGNYVKKISKGYKLTTNNRMELMAVIAALQLVKEAPLKITIISDSQYIINSVEKGWLNNWIKTNFKGGKKNKDLWMQYHQLAKPHHVKFIWVKGHADNQYNNECDLLATAAADNKLNLIEDVGYLLEIKNNTNSKLTFE
jgi:ribonuclease HI